MSRESEKLLWQGTMSYPCKI